MKLGNAISAVATPVAGLLGLDCYDPVTRDLRPESTCAKVRTDLNEGRYKDAFYDRFFPSVERNPDGRPIKKNRR